MYGEDEPLPRFNTFLYFTVFIVNLAAFSMGASSVLSSPAITRLNGLVDADENPLDTSITPSEEGIITSLLFIGAVFTAAISRGTLNTIGRKATLCISALPNLFGFAFLTTAKTLPVFYLGRFLNGLSLGIVFSVAPLYVREISDTNNRKFLASSLIFSINLGHFLVYAIAPFCELRTLSMINIFPSVAFLILFVLCAPESPYYYVERLQMQEAWKALKKLRCNNERIVDWDLTLIQKNVVMSMTNLTSVYDILHDKKLLRKLLISIGLILLHQLVGVNIIFVYMESILREMQIVSVELTTVILSGLQLILSLFSPFMVTKFKRKTALRVSSVGMMISLFFLGIFLYLKQYYINLNNYKLFPVISLCFFVCESTLGFSPFVATVLREIFPPYANSLATSIEITVFFITAVITSAIFPIVKDLVNIGFIFCLFGTFCAVTFAFVHFLVPETKEQSLND